MANHNTLSNTAEAVAKLKQRDFNPDSVEGEYPVLKLWGTLRPKRLLAGLFAGWVAGIMMFLFGVVVCMFAGLDLLMPIKVAAIPVVGAEALRIGMTSAVLVGILFQATLMGFLGAAYAHFTGFNHVKALFPMGLTWGIFGWVFIHSLMFKSFIDYRTAGLHDGVMFFAWIVYGVSLMSVMFFDRSSGSVDQK